MALATKDWVAAFQAADRAIWRQAAAEVLTIGIISVLPLVLAGVARYFTAMFYTPEAPNDFVAVIWGAIASGQLLFYALSFVATIIYYSCGDITRDFPLRLLYVVISFLFGVLVVLFIGINPSGEKLAVGPISILSIIIYLVSAFMYWTVAVFKEIDPPDYDKSLREGEDAVASDLQTLRSQQ